MTIAAKLLLTWVGFAGQLTAQPSEWDQEAFDRMLDQLRNKRSAILSGLNSGIPIPNLHQNMMQTKEFVKAMGKELVASNEDQNVLDKWLERMNYELDIWDPVTKAVYEHSMHSTELKRMILPLPTNHRLQICFSAYMNRSFDNAVELKKDLDSTQYHLLESLAKATRDIRNAGRSDPFHQVWQVIDAAVKKNRTFYDEYKRPSSPSRLMQFLEIYATDPNEVYFDEEGCIYSFWIAGRQTEVIAVDGEISVNELVMNEKNHIFFRVGKPGETKIWESGRKGDFFETMYPS